MPEAEAIADNSALHRQIDFPTMCDGAEKLIWDVIFQFPSSCPHESLVWDKYAPTDTDVHKLGMEREAIKRKTKPEMRYIGFISSTASSIRQIRTAVGHGFAVAHKPEEGIWHVAIYYNPANNRTVESLSKNEKTDLKASLRKRFGAPVLNNRDSEED
jgi:hypothetical protein